MKNQKGKNNHNWKGGKEKKICPFCNEIFYEWRSQQKITCGKKECHSKQLSKVKKGIINVAENNPKWKGNKVKYGGLHDWIKRHKPKSEFCEECKINKPYDLANISEEYKRDINDFEWLCRKCHMKKDGRLYNFNKK